MTFLDTSRSRFWIFLTEIFPSLFQFTCNLRKVPITCRLTAITSRKCHDCSVMNMYICIIYCLLTRGNQTRRQQNAETNEKMLYSLTDHSVMIECSIRTYTPKNTRVFSHLWNFSGKLCHGTLRRQNVRCNVASLIYLCLLSTMFRSCCSSWRDAAWLNITAEADRRDNLAANNSTRCTLSARHIMHGLLAGVDSTERLCATDRWVGSAARCRRPDSWLLCRIFSDILGFKLKRCPAFIYG